MDSDFGLANKAITAAIIVLNFADLKLYFSID
jgi:hypothetical protein